MSQSKRFCMGIAESEEYRGLESAIKDLDEEETLRCFYAINSRVNAFFTEVTERIRKASQVKDNPNFLYGHAKRDAEQSYKSFRTEAEKYIPVYFDIQERVINELDKTKTIQE